MALLGVQDHMGVMVMGSGGWQHLLLSASTLVNSATDRQAARPGRPATRAQHQQCQGQRWSGMRTLGAGTAS